MEKLLVFKMGKQKAPCPNCTAPPCPFKIGLKLCKLYTCTECKDIIMEGQSVVRVIFQPTRSINKRTAYYGRIGNQEKVDSLKALKTFVTFHKDCYIRQHIKWIEEKLEEK